MGGRTRSASPRVCILREFGGETRRLGRGGLRHWSAPARSSPLATRILPGPSMTTQSAWRSEKLKVARPRASPRQPSALPPYAVDSPPDKQLREW